MWRIKRRRTKPKENTAKTGVIYPKLNATAKLTRYVNRNTYLDVKCNRNKGAGCTIVGCQCSTDASGNTYCCKTTPYRNPILGYRKHLLDCSGNTDNSGCGYTNDVSGNIYKDNYAKSCANSLVCYNPVIKRTQNRNGCVNESYNYSTNQYLTRRCLTFSQQEFNFQSQVPVDASGCCTKFMSCANCQYTTTLNQTQIIVSAAKGDNTLLYTKDGIIWKGLGADVFGEQANVVKNNGTIWVAGGLHSTGLVPPVPHTLAYSYDGLNWVGNSGIVLSQECYDIAYSSDYWLAIGEVLGSGNLYSLVGSTDGKTWSEITIVSPNPFFDSTQFTPNGIAYGGGKWVLFGKTTTTKNIYYSTDNGLNWTVASTSAPGFTIRAMRGYYNGTIWVAVGQGNRGLAWSSDGVIWINATGHDFDGGGTDVFYNGDLWVASGGGAVGHKLLYSPDGKNWLACTLPSGASLKVNSVTYGKLGPWVAGSGPEYYYSSDGITWVDSNAVDVTEAGYMDSAITSSSISPYKCTCSTTGFCTGINKLPCEVKNTKCFAVYKRSNGKFNRQGAVSGGSRINRLKYQTRVVAAQRIKNGKNNVINRRGPSALYTTSRPLTMNAPGCWLNKGRTKGLLQRCVNNPTASGVVACCDETLPDGVIKLCTAGNPGCDGCFYHYEMVGYLNAPVQAWTNGSGCEPDCGRLGQLPYPTLLGTICPPDASYRSNTIGGFAWNFNENERHLWFFLQTDHGFNVDGTNAFGFQFTSVEFSSSSSFLPANTVKLYGRELDIDYESATEYEIHWSGEDILTNWNSANITKIDNIFGTALNANKNVYIKFDLGP